MNVCVEKDEPEAVSLCAVVRYLRTRSESGRCVLDSVLTEGAVV